MLLKLADPDTHGASKYVNFHAFVARFFIRNFGGVNLSTWAIWALRDALEHNHEACDNLSSSENRDSYVSAAAQWILWSGQSLFQSLILVENGSGIDSISGKQKQQPEKQEWKPGPLYKGRAELSRHRWRFWRDRFGAFASGSASYVATSAGNEKDGGADVPCSEECQHLARKAAILMGVLEDSLTF